MAPSAIPVDGFLCVQGDGDFTRPSKRARLASVDGHDGEHDGNHDGDDVDATTVAIPSHPLDVKPSGNIYTASIDLKKFSGLFARLPDELLLQLLEFLDARSLNGLGGTCKALYAFTRFEDVWKALFLE